MTGKPFFLSFSPLAPVVFLALVGAFLPNLVVAQDARSETERSQRLFSSPETAVKALVDAFRSRHTAAIKAVLGPGSGKLLLSGDAAEDEKGRQQFLAAFDQAARIEKSTADRAILHIGDAAWPMPFPLLKTGSYWRFDVKEARQELLARRLGENELSAIQVMLAYVSAQREYVLKDRDNDGLLEYSQRFVSTPGKKDGLFWPTAVGEKPSPIGPVFAAASEVEGDAAGAMAAPYHGYYYRILKAQGAAAVGGAYDYLVNGKMIGGFALIGYPARYRASGVSTFIVNHDGMVYSKDLGQESGALARQITLFNPDDGWKREEIR